MNLNKKIKELEKKYKLEKSEFSEMTIEEFLKERGYKNLIKLMK